MTSVNGARPDVLEMAREMVRHHFAPLPLPRGSKKPTMPGWEKLRLTEEELPQAFLRRRNVSALNGEPSHGRVDVDLDAPEALALADVFLPPTPCG